MCESCDQAHWGSSIHTRSKTNAEQSLNMLNIGYMYFSIDVTIGVCHSCHVIRILQVKSSCTNRTYKIDIELRTTLLSTVSPCRRVRRRVCPLCLQRGGRAPHTNTLYHGLATRLYLSMDFHKELLKCFTDIVSRLGTDFKEMFNVVVICKLGSQEDSHIIVNTHQPRFLCGARPHLLPFICCHLPPVLQV